MTQDQHAIKALLTDYEAALNASNAEQATGMYAAEGTFMPTGAPTASGTEAILATYRYIFSQIRLDIAFDIHEIVVSGDVAFAHTSSRGTVTVLATDARAPEANRELFFLRRENGSWKVSHYMFNKAA